MNLKKIKKEIIDTIKREHISNSSLLTKINKELEILENTIGIEGKNTLETFYNIWEKNKNKIGNKNEINSWTAYGLKMTNKKPTGEFLPSRRVFARAGFPDIDTDFDDEKRDEIYDYIIKKYGRKNVGNVGTHGLLKFKSCITRIVKVLDVADSFHKGQNAYITDNANKVTEILSSFPKKGVNKVRDSNGDLQVINSVKDAYKYCSDFRYYMDKYPEVMKHAKNIEGTFANFSIHAGGICISDIPLERLASLRTAGKGMLATQYSKENVEKVGLIKFDILAVSTLTVIKRTLALIKKNYDIEIDIENLSLDDENTFALYRSGNLAGVFQCESGLMQKTMIDIGVNKFEDIMAAISLFRPGPMESIPEYCARKKGIRKIDYFHPSIKKYVESYLKDTYGIAIYQESVMQICNSLAGFSITDGYIMIKAIGKKKKHLMGKFEKQFIEGCVKNDIPREIAKQYWKKFIIPFASYGFNRSHSAAYGFTSYICCYLKANYTAEFISCLLSVEAERAHPEKIEHFEKDFTKKLHILFLPRTINNSKFSYVIEKKRNLSLGIYKTEIRPSLLCKGVGIKAAKNLEKNQSYKNLRNLAEKTDGSIVDARVIDALTENGYFGRKMKKKKENVVKNFVQIKKDIKAIQKKGMETTDIFI